MFKSLRIICVLFLLCIGIGCDTGNAVKTKHEIVNPFIGTGGHGHTFPGPTRPFGMVQLGPDTRLEGWDGCSGYHYTDNRIYGFSHTHLSGTGISDYGDILFMPYLGDFVFTNGADGGPGYSASFLKKNEYAHAGYYRVHLEEPNILAEFTSTERAGFHRYTYKEDSISSSSFIIDLEHRDEVLAASFEQIDSFTVSGWRQSTGWAKEQDVFFYAKFSLPIQELLIQDSLRRSPGLKKAESSNIKANLRFNIEANQELLVKVGISSVDINGAKLNLEQELEHWDFDACKKASELSWDRALSKIEAEFSDPDQEVNFYTALYHSMIAPNLFTDVDGRYRQIDRKIARSLGQKYTVFSLWDTHRATHPLHTILEPARTNEFIETLIDHYRVGGKLSKWELSGNYTNTMVGYHALSVIADAYMKGIRGYNIEEALESMIATATYDEEGVGLNIKHGYIASDLEPESVSKTLEYSYDDWCLAIMAEDMGKTDVASTYYKRAQHYKNVYDHETGFMRARSRNSWFGPFDPYEVNFNYTEANAWQYNYAVPHDIQELIRVKGGKQKFEESLDELFSANQETSGRDQADITGLIGQYAHGNEPSHHIAYLYNFTDSPHKTQELTNRILETLYQNEPDGLSGNEDCGQMSSWYVFSALGIYPVCPGFPKYTLTAPIVKEAVIYLENGKRFEISVRDAEKGIYIQKVMLNGRELSSPVINHNSILNGGLLEYFMGEEPNEYLWPKDLSKQWIPANKEPFVTSPFIDSGLRNFYDTTTIVLGQNTPAAELYYTTDGSDPVSNGTLYKQPFTIQETTTVRAISKQENVYSFEAEMQFSKIPNKRTVSLTYPYANQYNAGGDNALVDFEKGGDNFRTGAWQGYEGVDLDAKISLANEQTINELSIRFIQDQDSWIFLPEQVAFYYSIDGEKYAEMDIVVNETDPLLEQVVIQEFKTTQKVKAKYFRVLAKNRGVCPPGHKGEGGQSWIFSDEITIK